jgi:hypothetical protein
MTIKKCFQKSTCIETSQVSNDLIDITQQKDRELLRSQIISIPNLTNPLTINEFIQPYNEQINDDLDDIIESIIHTYSQAEDVEEESLP